MSKNEIEVREQLRLCLGSAKWVEEVMKSWPYNDFRGLEKACLSSCQNLSEADWLEAFGCHPRIGADLQALREKYQKFHSQEAVQGASWSTQEQAGVQSASDEVLMELQQGNLNYEKKFGFVFLICATGKSAFEMLAALKERLGNTRDQELANAADEQKKIMLLRLAKWQKQSSKE